MAFSLNLFRLKHVKPNHYTDQSNPKLNESEQESEFITVLEERITDSLGKTTIKRHHWQSQIVGKKGEMIETIELLIHQVL
jgi:hypothetical protein